MHIFLFHILVYYLGKEYHNSLSNIFLLISCISSSFGLSKNVILLNASDFKWNRNLSEPFSFLSYNKLFIACTYLAVSASRRNVNTLFTAAR